MIRLTPNLISNDLVIKLLNDFNNNSNLFETIYFTYELAEKNYNNRMFVTDFYIHKNETIYFINPEYYVNNTSAIRIFDPIDTSIYVDCGNFIEFTAENDGYLRIYKTNNSDEVIFDASKAYIKKMIKTNFIQIKSFATLGVDYITDIKLTNVIVTDYGESVVPIDRPSTHSGIIIIFGSEYTNTGKFFIYIDNKNNLFIKNIFGTNNKISDWVFINDNTNINILEQKYTKLNNYIGMENNTFNINYESEKQSIVTEFSISAGETIRIYLDKVNGTTTTGRVSNMFIKNLDTNISYVNSNYIGIYSSTNYIDFTAENDGNLVFYNGDWFSGSITVHIERGIKLDLLKLAETNLMTYAVVDLNGDGDYTSFTQCLIELNKLPFDSKKMVYVNGGVYDLFQEYIDAEVSVYTGSNPSMDYVPYSVFIPNNTHIIGRGRVVLKMEIEPGQCSSNQSKVLSCVNTGGSMILENVELVGKNCRYCIHDDPLGDIRFDGAYKIFKNVKTLMKLKENNNLVGDTNVMGFGHNLGFGIDKRMYVEYDNCEFINENLNSYSFYGHSRANVGGELTEADSSTIVVKDCTIIGNGSLIDGKRYNTVFGSNGNMKIDTYFKNCYFGGGANINISKEGSRISIEDNVDARNVFNLTIQNCNIGIDNIRIINGINDYEPKVYNY